MSGSGGAASPGDLLFAKASIFANHVQDGAATSCAQREISVSVATNRPFGKLICYLFVFWKNTAMSEK